MAIIRSTTHHFDRLANSGKLAVYAVLRQQMYECLVAYINYLWNHRIEWTNRVLDIANNLLDCPNFISTKNLALSNLSARLQKCLSTQACGIIKGIITAHKKTAGPLVKPIISPNINFEISSLCLDILQSGSGFDYWIRLKCLGTDFGHIKLPIKAHKRSNKFKRSGKLLNSWLLGSNYVCLRWELEPKPTKSKQIVGVDQGYKTILTLSNGKSTDDRKHPHGHNLESIIDQLSYKRRGSKGFQRVADFRDNFVRWSINQLNLKQYKEIRLENIKYLRRGRKTSKKLSHWNYALIKKKVESDCEVAGVQLTYNFSAYRSQRCFRCGLVKKSNRRDKLYKCDCGYSADADLNAAKNNAVDLFRIPSDFLQHKYNVLGFYWLANEINLCGQEPTIPATKKSIDLY